VASEGNTSPLHGWHVEAAATHGAGIGGTLARSGDSSAVRIAPAQRAVGRRRGGLKLTRSVL
jgi:hypothetical protein